MKKKGNFYFLIVFSLLNCYVPKLMGFEKKTNLNQIITQCAVCHGTNGNANSNLTTPKLAGQHSIYLYNRLKTLRNIKQFAQTQRVMQKLLIPLSDFVLKQLADYYAELPATIDFAQPKAVLLGQQLYRGGDYSRKIPACLACHGPGGLGNASAAFPRLSGQHAQYLVNQLKAFRDGTRKDKLKMMACVTKKMTNSDIWALGNYISGLYQ